ncbi:hypothetical protein ETB97_010243 [Aspergillus alliaceus]|uniref:Uncharacterized protein n=1 Tax=Petromyces alliaceus TaxID=209559 RepID=A0A8H6A5V4_PETAA|nr:hypothetical protein ETB97_010243 [Aspergillus burnettii]
MRVSAILSLILSVNPVAFGWELQAFTANNCGGTAVQSMALSGKTDCEKFDSLVPIKSVRGNGAPDGQLWASYNDDCTGNLWTLSGNGDCYNSPDNWQFKSYIVR